MSDLLTQLAQEFQRASSASDKKLFSNAISAIQEKESRIKELESTVLDLQSELARKKYSLTVACNRVEELEDKLSKCQDIAMGLGIKYNEQQDKLKIAVDCLKRQLGEEWVENMHETLAEIGELK